MIPSSRIAVARGDTGVIVTMPAKRNWLTIGFLVVWCAGWLAGELFTLSELLSGLAPGAGALFLVVWLVLWTCGGVLALGTLAWNLWGLETVTLTRSALSLRMSVGPIGETRTYDVRHVERLDVWDPNVERFAEDRSREGPHFRDGRLAFEHRRSTVRFGSLALTDLEARWVVEALTGFAPYLSERGR